MTRTDLSGFFFFYPVTLNELIPFKYRLLANGYMYAANVRHS